MFYLYSVSYLSNDENHHDGGIVNADTYDSALQFIEQAYNRTITEIYLTEIGTDHVLFKDDLSDYLRAL